VWDPARYLQYADERARPFHELLARVPDPPRCRSVLDLGCGTGVLTARLTRRWPSAQVIGVDSSAEMLAAADPQAVAAGVRLVQADLREWRPDASVDVIVTHATLQWVPDHLDLLPRLAGWLAPGGVLALQVPGNVAEPSHVLLRDLADSPRWSPYVGKGRVARPASYGPREYFEVLAGAGLAVDAWETTYLHVLKGEDAVLRWVSGTALRPVLAALPDDAAREAFVAEYGAALREAYAPGPYGTVLPFRRVFAVGRGLHVELDLSRARSR
jgi:trans-aconitate 2-methyltransferase